MAEIIEVNYTAGDGTVWPLQMDKLIRIKTANFHNWTYEPETIARKMGVRVVSFGKQPASYRTTVYFGGSIEDRKSRIDELHTEIERDIRNLTPGKLTWGDWYLECYIRASSTYPDTKTGYTVNEIEIYAPYPFWIKPQTASFVKQEYDPGESPWLDYDYGYDYDYTPDPIGEGQIVIDAPGASEFKLIYYGPVASPRAIIAGVPRGIDTALSEGDYLTIDSRSKTAIVTRENGEKINVFNLRDKYPSVFTQIPAGTAPIEWSGAYGFDITVYKERSEPAWS